jgi:hypothetical protein
MCVLLSAVLLFQLRCLIAPQLLVEHVWNILAGMLGQPSAADVVIGGK